VCETRVLLLLAQQKEHCTTLTFLVDVLPLDRLP
jgi:hypothetical protein